MCSSVAVSAGTIKSYGNSVGWFLSYKGSSYTKTTDGWAAASWYAYNKYTLATHRIAYNYSANGSASTGMKYCALAYTPQYSLHSCNSYTLRKVMKKKNPLK